MAALLDRLLGRDAPAEPAPAAPAPDHALRVALAQKVLRSWAQNRQQVLVPLALNLARMEPAPRRLVRDAMATALAACNVAEPMREARLAAAMARIGGDDAPAAPRDLLALVAEIEAARLGAHAYAATALVLDRREPVERAFLDWLAARFALPPQLTAGLARRYRR